jgi:hypothetical protein
LISHTRDFIAELKAYDANLKDYGGYKKLCEVAIQKMD